MDDVSEDDQRRHDLELVNSFEDLGGVFSPEIMHHEQVDAAVWKARSAAFEESK